jgi:tRNA A37 threonylcarbamoyladenosine dehydratase
VSPPPHTGRVPTPDMHVEDTSFPEQALPHATCRSQALIDSILTTEGVGMLDQARFGGVARLYGEAALASLAKAHVAVVGVGGVGSWTVEALSRSGVGSLTMIDLDEVCVSNTNRQSHALASTVGRTKVEVLQERVLAIHPTCTVHTHTSFFTPKTADSLLEPTYDVVVDAIDQPKNKALLIARCAERGIHVVCVGAAGGRQDPTAIQTGDLAQSSSDALLRRVRKILRREHGFAPANEGPWGITSIYSMETPVFPDGEGDICDDPTASESPLRMGCATGYGAACHVTGAFGFVAAGAAIDRIVLP